MIFKKKSLPDEVTLEDIITHKNIHFITTKNITDTISTLLNFSNSEEITSLNTMAILEKLKTREQLISTGLGQGIAIPHVGIENIQNFSIQIGILRNEINWHAFDRKPVRIVILILFPIRKRNNYLRIIGKLSRILMQDTIRTALITSQNEELAVTLLSNSS